MANAAPLLVYLRAIDLPLASTIEKISPTPREDDTGNGQEGTVRSILARSACRVGISPTLPGDVDDAHVDCRIGRRGARSRGRHARRRRRQPRAREMGRCGVRRVPLGTPRRRRADAIRRRDILRSCLRQRQRAPCNAGTPACRHARSCSLRSRARRDRTRGASAACLSRARI